MSEGAQIRQFERSLNFSNWFTFVRFSNRNFFIRIFTSKRFPKEKFIIEELV